MWHFFSSKVISSWGERRALSSEHTRVHIFESAATTAAAKATATATAIVGKETHGLLLAHSKQNVSFACVLGSYMNR